MGRRGPPLKYSESSYIKQPHTLQTERWGPFCSFGSRWRRVSDGRRDATDDRTSGRRSSSFFLSAVYRSRTALTNTHTCLFSRKCRRNPIRLFVGATLRIKDWAARNRPFTLDTCDRFVLFFFFFDLSHCRERVGELLRGRPRILFKYLNFDRLVF